MKRLLTKVGFLVIGCGLLTACGFHLRNEARLPNGMTRVHIDIADPISPLKRNLKAALQRSGASVEEAAGEGITELKIPVVALSPEVQAVGATARVRQFVMLYHVEIEAVGANGKTLLPKQTVELSREFTFDETQALGTAQVQEDLKKQMERDMVQAILRRLEAVGRVTGA